MCYVFSYSSSREVDDPLNQRKYVVFEDKLVDLFKVCKCGSLCDVRLLQPKSFGSMVKVKATCTHCDENVSWESQPRIGDVPAGNLLFSCAALFGGESPDKFFRTLANINIQAITSRTFHNHQAQYLQPAVVTTWKEHQAALIAELLEKGEPLVLGGDGRADSPGHCAKYGTYTMMDLSSGKVIDIQLVQVSKKESQTNRFYYFIYYLINQLNN